MSYNKKRVELSDNIQYYREYFNSLQGGFDDFYECRILESNHYQLYSLEVLVAVFSINDENRLTSLYVFEDYKISYSAIFSYIVELEEVNKIISVTNDTMFLNEVISRDFVIIKQACNFIYLDKKKSEIELVLAKDSDLEEIKSTFGDFLSDYEQKIADQKIFIYRNYDCIVTLVDVAKQIIDMGSYSIGMITNESFRNQRFGSRVLTSVANALGNKGFEVHAGCWYYNYASRRTLNKAGLVMVNLIYRVDSI